MRILGIDPGLAIMGYGVIEYDKNKMTLIDYGTVLTQPNLVLPQRLGIIFNSTLALIDQFCPDSIAFEELFFNKNVKTALAVGHARGAAITAAYSKMGELYEYTPLQVKQAVVGYGRAEKQQVQMMVKTILALNEVPQPDDAADACAVAICHAHSIKFKKEFSI